MLRVQTSPARPETAPGERKLFNPFIAGISLSAC